MKVQIKLKVERLKPQRPKPTESLLVFIDLNSSYGIVVAYVATNGLKTKLLEVNHFYPPNQGRRKDAAKKRQRAITHGHRGVNDALLRLTLRFDSRGWLKRVANEIIKKAFKYAAGRPVTIRLDMPPSGLLRHSPLQRTMTSFGKILQNICNWHGLHLEVRPLPSSKCPHCGSRLKEVYRTRRVRVMHCNQCGFMENRELVPLHWWVRKLGLPPLPVPIRALPSPPNATA